MKESQFLGTLLPSHPDFLLIEKAIREKYSLPEISPDDDPIVEIYFGDEIMPLEVFRKDIETHVRANLSSFMPPDLLKLYLSGTAFSKTQHKTQHQEELESLSTEMKDGIEEIYKFIDFITDFVSQFLEPMIDAIVNMLYIHLLTGDAQEVPNDWISKVATVTSMGEPMVMAMAGPMANLDVIVHQFRAEYKKTFGDYHPKITQTAVTTAYYIQLKKAHKPWKYIVEEYIRLSKVSLPRDRTSKRYVDIWHRAEQTLRKRILRTEIILDVLLTDKK